MKYTKADHWLHQVAFFRNKGKSSNWEGTCVGTHTFYFH